MTHDEYIELSRDTLEALRKFIRASEPGKSLIPIHTAFSVIKSTIEAADPDSEIATARRRADEQRERSQQDRERRDAEQSERERQHQEYGDARSVDLA